MEGQFIHDQLNRLVTFIQSEEFIQQQATTNLFYTNRNWSEENIYSKESQDSLLLTTLEEEQE